MRDFLKTIGRRLGLADAAGEKTGKAPEHSPGGDGAPVAPPVAATDSQNDTDRTPQPEELEYIVAQDFYRRDGHYPDETPKWQLRRRMAVRIRNDMWQIRETHTALRSPPADDTVETYADAEVIANDIIDMVDTLDSALGLLKAFEDQLNAEDWLASAAAPEHPTRAEISALLAQGDLSEAAE